MKNSICESLALIRGDENLGGGTKNLHGKTQCLLTGTQLWIHR